MPRSFRAGLFVAVAFALLVAPEVKIGTFSTATVIGVEQAHAQRSRRNQSQAEGETVVSQEVADGYNVALEALQADNPSGAIAAVAPLAGRGEPL